MVNCFQDLGIQEREDSKPEGCVVHFGPARAFQNLSQLDPSFGCSVLVVPLECGSMGRRILGRSSDAVDIWLAY